MMVLVVGTEDVPLSVSTLLAPPRLSVPLTVRPLASVWATLPRLNVAPLATVTALLEFKASATLVASVPPLTVVAPV